MLYNAVVVDPGWGPSIKSLFDHLWPALETPQTNAAESSTNRNVLAFRHEFCTFHVHAFPFVSLAKISGTPVCDFSSQVGAVGDEEHEEGEDDEFDEKEASGMSGRPMTHIRSLTHKMTTRPSATVQNGIDELLQKLFVKHGGEAAGSNMFFSEGDEDTERNQDDSSPTISQADCRIRKKNSRRNVKHVTHSGVLSPAAVPLARSSTASSNSGEAPGGAG